MPSIEFSIGTNPRSTSPLLDGVEHVGHRAVRDVLGVGQVGLGRSACWVNVPNGPKNPTRFLPWRQG